MNLNELFNTLDEHIRKLPNGKYRLYSKKTNKNLGTFDSKSAAEKHEKAVQYFKHKGVTEKIAYEPNKPLPENRKVRSDKSDKSDKSDDESSIQKDPELYRKLSRAKRAYSHLHTDEEVLLKLMQRAEFHGEQEDKEQDRRLNKLEKQVRDLEIKTGPDPLSTYMSESRIHKRQLAQQILTQKN